MSRVYPSDATLFNEYHALIVHTGKRLCRSRVAICSSCVLRPFLTRPVEGVPVSPVTNKLRIRLVLGGMLVTLLLGAVFTMGSLDVPFEPRSWREIIALFAVNSFITAALLIFGLILIRGFVRLRMEQSKAQLGARFKTKMVLGAMAISLLPSFSCFSSAIPCLTAPSAAGSRAPWK